MSGPGPAAWVVKLVKKTTVAVFTEDDGLNAEDTLYSVQVHFFFLK